MGGAEAVEEVQEGNPPLQGCQMGHRGQVHDLLDAALRENGHAGLAAGIDVRMVAEDGQGMGGDGPGGHMDHARQQLPRHAVEIGQHEQKPLGGGEGGGQGTGQQRPVDGGRRTGLGLHLGDDHGLSVYVLPSLPCPLVHKLRHGGGGRDGVDGRRLAVGVGHMGRGLTAVHGLEGAGRGMGCRVRCHILHKKSSGNLI